MSNVYFTSDLHLKHKGILHFSKGFRNTKSLAEHDNWVIGQINTVVTPRDKLFILGDVAFSEEGLKLIANIRTKNLHLVLGNHDKLDIELYLKYFQKVSGTTKYKGHWLSHFPMHESELWGKPNIHGHTHTNFIDDPRYINVCTETSHGLPVSFETIKSGSHFKYYKNYFNLVKQK